MCIIVDLFQENRYVKASKMKPELWDAMRSPFRAKSINDSMFMEDFSK